MPTKLSDPNPPRGLMRLLFRFPICMYRIGLGWLLGSRFLELTHIGRTSGLPRRAVIEVIKRDRSRDVYYIVSAWGEKADWYRNVMKSPRVGVQVGLRRWQATADRLPPDEAAEVMLDYGRRHASALRMLARFIGYRVERSEEDYRAFGRLLPIIAIRPA